MSEARRIEWQESHNGVSFDCALDIVRHEGGKDIFITIPGVDGSTNGYKDKYLRIASEVNKRHGHTVYQMDNPYISRLHWESNIRQLLHHIYDTEESIGDVHIMAHSAGAWIISRIAWEYPEIKQLLLVNPATNIPDITDYQKGISQAPHLKTTFLIGGKDPSLAYKETFEHIPNNHGVMTDVIANANHDFAGDTFSEFIDAPHRYLFP